MIGFGLPHLHCAHDSASLATACMEQVRHRFSVSCGAPRRCAGDCWRDKLLKSSSFIYQYTSQWSSNFPLVLSWAPASPTLFVCPETSLCTLYIPPAWRRWGRVVHSLLVSVPTPATARAIAPVILVSTTLPGIDSRKPHATQKRECREHDGITRQPPELGDTSHGEVTHKNQTDEIVKLVTPCPCLSTSPTRKNILKC